MYTAAKDWMELAFRVGQAVGVVMSAFAGDGSNDADNERTGSPDKCEEIRPRLLPSSRSFEDVCPAHTRT